MRTVHKFPLQHGRTRLPLPPNAWFLRVDVQHGEWVAWFCLDTDDEIALRTFQVFGTGHDMGTEHWLHLGTFYQDETKSLVWHLFEELRQPVEQARLPMLDGKEKSNG